MKDGFSVSLRPTQPRGHLFSSTVYTVYLHPLLVIVDLTQTRICSYELDSVHHVTLCLFFFVSQQQNKHLLPQSL